MLLNQQIFPSEICIKQWQKKKKKFLIIDFKKIFHRKKE